MQLLTNHFRKLSKNKVQLLQTILEKFFYHQEQLL